MVRLLLLKMSVKLSSWNTSRWGGWGMELGRELMTKLRAGKESGGGVRGRG